MHKQNFLQTEQPSKVSVRLQ